MKKENLSIWIRLWKKLLTENDKLIAKVSVYLPSVELIALTSI